MLSGRLAAELSPEPILRAAEGYRGSVVDLDRGWSVSGDSLSRGRSDVAQQLRRSGLQAGDRVVLAVGNGPQFVTALTGVLSELGSPLLLHPRTPATELKRTALRFGARWLLTDARPPEELERQGLRTRSLNGAAWLELVWAELRPDTPGFQQGHLRLPAVPLHPTSGTTGVPKIAARPGPCAVAEAEHYVRTLDIGPRDTLLAVAPMTHAYAYGMCVMVPLISGASVVSLRSFSPRQVFQAIQEHGIRILPAVPAMLDMLMFGAGERLRSDWRQVLTAGSPLPQRTAARFERIAGAAPRPLYGTTETGGISVASPEIAARLATGCVGRPMAGVEVEVRPSDDEILRQEGIGAVYVRSASMMAGYVESEQLDTSPLQDGWFQTGDLARVDEHGAVHLRGRTVEVINVSGMKVIPGEVEEVIAALPGVREVKVYAGHTRQGDQFVKAAVVTEGGPDVHAIGAHCDAQLVYYKRPERIIPVPALPRSPSGKIVTDQLP